MRCAALAVCVGLMNLIGLVGGSEPSPAHWLASWPRRVAVFEFFDEAREFRTQAKSSRKVWAEFSPLQIID